MRRVFVVVLDSLGVGALPDAAAGAVVSEWPPGTPPDAFRSTQRNRILAALSEIVLVADSGQGRPGRVFPPRVPGRRTPEMFLFFVFRGTRRSIKTQKAVYDDC